MPKNTTKITTETTPAVIQTTPKPSTGLGFKIFTITSLILILCLSGTALGFSLFNFFQEEAPITFNYGSGDSNSASFVEGSIAEVANRLAPAVVSINFEGRS